MSGLYKVSKEKLSQDSIPHRNLGLWLNPVDEKEVITPCGEVYTQEMADEGELPTVGMECCAYIYAETSRQGNPNNSWVNGEFVRKCKAPNGGSCFIFKAEDGVHHVINANSHFKPIEPPKTVSEKAFDKFLDDQYNSTISEFQKSESDRDFIEGLQSAWNAAIKYGSAT